MVKEQSQDLDVFVGFSTTNKWISRLIRWVTGSPVSHAFIVFTSPVLGKVALQAEAWGLEVRPWDRWKEENTLIAEFRPIGRNMSDAVQRFAREFVGRPYDWKSAFFSGLWKWFGRWFKGHFSSPRRLMCSEATIRVLQSSGYSSVEHFDPEVTNPVRLLERMLEMSLVFGEQFELIYAHANLKPWISKARQTNV